MLKTVCVYCGSAVGSDPRFVAAAEEFGRLLVSEGLGLVYGGGNSGLMGAVARATLAAGGKVCGIIPEFLKSRELMLREAQELIVVPDMHTRKQLMFERADAFVALPGGIGTLEELVEQMTWAQLERHAKPILLLNIAGFWRPLLSLLAHMRESQFIRAESEVRYIVAERVADAIPMLRQAAARSEAREEPPAMVIGKL